MAGDPSDLAELSKVLKDLAPDAGASGSLADLASCWMASWPAMMLAVTQAMEAAGGKRNEDDSSSSTPAAGSPAAAASSGDGLHDLDQLLCRLDAVERRLADLEAGCVPAKAKRRC